MVCPPTPAEFPSCGGAGAVVFRFGRLDVEVAAARFVLWSASGTAGRPEISVFYDLFLGIG